MVIGLKWHEILERAPEYFSCRYQKLRSKQYGVAVHGDFVRISKQLNNSPHKSREFGLHFSYFCGLRFLLKPF